MTTIGSALRRHDPSRRASHDPMPVTSLDATARALGPARAAGGRLRDVLGRAGALLDPPETERHPGALARTIASWRTFTCTHVEMTDGGLACAVFALGFLTAELAHRSVAAGLLTFLLALPLAWRRRAPISVFLVIAVVAFAQWLANLVLVADVALLIALYTVAVHRPRRAAIAGAVILEGGAVLAATRYGHSALATFASLSAVVVAVLVSGLYLRARRSQLAGLVERAERLEFERDQQARLAAIAERARLSREMHDTMAHSLAVVVSLANGATAKLGRDPEESRESLESIAELARQALGETRRLLSVLRTDEDPATSAHHSGIDQIPNLVDHAASTGLRATLTVHGEPIPLPAGLSLSAYRIVQEAITNAVKHAQGATTVTVALTWSPRRLHIAVTDDGHADRQATRTPGGFGLAGMRERAALYGGTARAGPRPEGGWIVNATLPITEPGTS